jgi:UDP-N-acetylglucosamine:LPS N-acetylglucosamine transferase
MVRMLTPKKKIALFTSSQGHLSISQALEHELKKKYEVVTFYERDSWFGPYLAFYKFFPGAFKIPFEVMKADPVYQILYRYYKNRYLLKIEKFIKKHKPDLYCSSYFMYIPALEEMSTAHSIPYINILTDPRTVHPQIISRKAAANISFDDQQITFCTKACPHAKYAKVGWFVRPEFEAEYSKKEVREQLGLEKNTLTFLISSGSDGTNFVTKIFPALLTSPKPLQIIVACGSNKTLFKNVKALADVVKKTNKKVQLTPLSFTSKMHQYVQVADLIIGKAGPNSLFEAVAALTPFFATTHIAGQEDGNLEIIREYTLGYVEENALKAEKIIRRIIRSPKELEHFTPYLKSMAEYNKTAKTKFVSMVDSLVKK